MEKKEISVKCNNCDVCDDIKKQCTQKSTYSLSSDSESELEDSTNYSESESETDITAAVEDKYDGESFEEDEEDVSLALVLDSLKCSSTNISQRKSAANKTFSSEKLRDIERTNGILMNKILSNTKRVNQYKIAPKTNNMNKISSAAINRKKDQEKIVRDNQILLKKIQSVKPSVMHK